MSNTKTQLQQVDEVALEVLDVWTRQDAKEKAGSRRVAYQKALEETRDIAGREAAEELRQWIENKIRTDEKFPASRQVRKQGADICRSRDHPIPNDSWLGA